MDLNITLQITNVAINIFRLVIDLVRDIPNKVE